jgi:hypothetical protein
MTNAYDQWKYLQSVFDLPCELLLETLIVAIVTVVNRSVLSVFMHAINRDTYSFWISFSYL